MYGYINVALLSHFKFIRGYKMKRLKTEQKRRFAAVVAIVLIIALVLSAVLPVFLQFTNAAPLNNEDYTIEADIGFDGNAKINSCIPVTVSVTNNTGKNFKGDISLPVFSRPDGFSDEASYTEYVNSVEIASGGSKTVSFNVPIFYIQNRELTISLMRGDKTVASQSFPVNILSDKEIWIGLLSDSPDRLTYIKPDYYVVDTNGRTVDISSEAESCPDVDFGCVDIFVINDYDIAAISDENLQDILDNVSRGKSVIIGNGSRIGSLDRLELDKLANYGQSYPPGTSARVYKFGSGFICSVDEDLANTRSESLTDTMSDIMSLVCSNPAVSQSTSELYDSLLGSTSRLPNLSDFTVKIIFGIIYIYILFIPVLYFVLKRRDKRENALKIIPVTALVISFLIYLVSFNTVYKKPIASIVNYIDLGGTDNTNIAMKTFVNVVSPSKGKLKIDIGKGKSLTYISDKSYYDNYYYNNNESLTYTDEPKIDKRIIVSDENTSIEMSDKTKWDNTYMSIDGRYEADGGLEGSISLDPQTGMLKGSIVNSSGVDMEESVLVVYTDIGLTDIIKIGELENGEDINLDELSVKFDPYASKSTYDFHDIINPYDSSPYVFRNENLEERYTLEKEQDILESYCDDCISSSTADGTGFTGFYVDFLGFSNDDGAYDDITVNNKKTNASTTNVFSKKYTVDLTGLAAFMQQDMQGSSGAVLFSDSNASYCGSNRSAVNVYDTDDYVEFELENPNYEDFKIIWNVDASEKEIYNDVENEWMPLFDLEYAAGYTEYNCVRVRARGFTSSIIDVPDIIYYGSTSDYMYANGQSGQANEIPDTEITDVPYYGDNN